MHALTQKLRRFARHLRDTRGQGTVEYVGIVLAVGALLLALVGPLRGKATPIATKVAAAVTHAIDSTTTPGGGQNDQNP